MFKKLFAAAACAMVMAQSSAGYVTFNEGALDSVFSQVSFGSSPIDIRHNLNYSIYNTDLLNLDNFSEMTNLSFYSSSGALNLFYVDTVTHCGGSVNSNYVGCGFISGNTLALRSSFVSGSLGTSLIAHEMGHNLGLGHYDSDSNNLMYSYINSRTLLTTTQATSILRSSFVKTDELGNRFINVNTIAVLASNLAPLPPLPPVPEPSTWAMIIAGLGLMLMKIKRA